MQRAHVGLVVLRKILGNINEYAAITDVVTDIKQKLGSVGDKL